MHLSRHLDQHPQRFWLIPALAAAVLLVVGIVIAMCSADSRPKLRVACVGDSTTWGTHATRANGVTYPDFLARLGKKTLQVRNYGVGATTLLRRSGRAWSDRGELAKVISFQPDVMVVMFGVNEISHPDLLDELWADALWLVDQFQNAIPGVEILLATPTPFAPGDGKSRENGDLRTIVIPVLRQVAQAKGCRVIEVNRDFPPTLDYLPDGLHPNAQGNHFLAQLIFDAIRKGEKACLGQPSSPR